MKAMHVAAGLLLAVFASFALATPMAYVPNEVSGTVSVIDTSTDKVLKDLKVSKRPRGIAVSPDGKRLYVTNTPTQALVVYDLTKDAVEHNWIVGDSPEGTSLSKDGKKVYVANEHSSSVTGMDAEALDTIGEIPVGERPWGVVIR